MSLLHVLAILLVVGILLALFNKFRGGDLVDGTVARIINIVVIVAVVLWLISLFFGPIPDIRIGR